LIIKALFVAEFRSHSLPYGRTTMTSKYADYCNELSEQFQELTKKNETCCQQTSPPEEESKWVLVKHGSWCLLI